MEGMPVIVVVPYFNLGGDKFLGARCEMWPTSGTVNIAKSVSFLSLVFASNP